MKSRSHFFALALISILFSSCFVQYINLNHKTPSSPGKYPKFTQKDTLRGSLNEFRTNFNVQHYDLHVDIDTDKKYIKGHVVVSFEAMEDLNKIQLDLQDHLQINSVKVGDKELSYERKYQAFFVTFDEKVSKGDLVQVKVEYEGKPIKAKKPPWEGGFDWKKDKNGNPWVGVACEVLGASSWWPVKDHLSDEPDSMDMYFTIPEGLFCVSNGRLIETLPSDGRSTFHWKVSNPINSYNVTFYIGNYERFVHPYKNESGWHELEYYVLPQFRIKAEEHFKQTKETVEYFEATFGEYPWWDDGFKLVTSPYAGMEHQTAIAYGSGLKNDQCGMDHILVHEVAHEWWGNSITVSDYSDIWLQEGFATYSEVLFAEHRIGERALFHNKVFGIMIQNSHPVIGPKDVNHWSYKESDPYMKGSYALSGFRYTLGNDSLFFSWLKSWYESHAKSIVTNQDFLDHVKEFTGEDYSWYFNQYLVRRNPPTFQYYFENIKGSENKRLHYRWADVNEDFKMPCFIHDGNEMIEITPTVNDQTIDLNLVGKFMVSDVHFYFKKEKKRF